MSLIPFFGQLRSIQTLVLGGITLKFVLNLVETINPGGFISHIAFIPDFWFVVGLLVIGGLVSGIGLLVAAAVASAIDVVQDGLGTLFTAPIAAIFGAFSHVRVRCVVGCTSKWWVLRLSVIYLSLNCHGSVISVD